MAESKRTRIDKPLQIALTIVLALVFLVPAGCGTGLSRRNPREVSLAIGYIPNVQFTPLYVAIEKGYFADEGLDPQLQYGSEADLMKLVGAGDLQFALASGDQVILARSQDIPIVYVMNWWHRFPVGVMSLAEKGIDEPADLVGKRVGISALSGASYIGWRAMLYASGIAPESVDVQVIGYAQVAAVSDDQVDAAVCYVSNEPQQLKLSGYDVLTLSVSDYIDLVSNGFITNADTVETLRGLHEPELVQAVVSATLRGLQYTLDHPDEAFDIAVKHIPELEATDMALQREVLAQSIDLWRHDRLGETTAAAWETSVEFMLEAGLIQERPAVGELYTNEFVEAAGE